ncbi:MAG: corrinoid protein [Alphaproteobacteria bacterium]|nr:corrinoid protein [Alphaproteobacteria bacterium]
MSVAEIYEAVLDYDDEAVPELVNAELEANTDLKIILDDGMIAALDDIGARFSEGTLFVPEMLMAAQAVQAGMDILRPLLAETGAKPVGTVVIGTVKGDLHDIGKNLVGMLLEGAGFQVVDLGVDIDAETFINAAQENEADLVAISGLLTTSMPEIESAVATIAEANTSRNLNVKVMVGGPPINNDFATRIGADGYGESAPAAVERARNLVAA